MTAEMMSKAKTKKNLQKMLAKVWEWQKRCTILSFDLKTENQIVPDRDRSMAGPRFMKRSGYETLTFTITIFREPKKVKS